MQCLMPQIKRVYASYYCNSKFFACCCLLLLALSCSAEESPVTDSYDPDDPPQGLFADDWMNVTLSGQKTGYINVQFRREGEEVHTRHYTLIRIRRQDNPVQVETINRTTETVSGKPLSLYTRSDMGGSIPTEITGTFEDGRITLVRKQGDQETQGSYPMPDDIRLLWGLAQASFKRGFEPGTEYTVPFYSSEMRPGAQMQAHIRVGEKETIHYRGKAVLATRVETTLGEGIHMPTLISWIDEEQRTLITRVDNDNMPLTMILVTQEEALADFEAPEIFLSTLIQLDRGIRRDSQEVVFRIEPTQKELTIDIVASHYVTVEPLDEEGARTVTIKRADFDDLRETLPRASTPEEMKPFLASSSLLNLDDPALHALLKESGAMKHNRTVKRAEALQQFVYDFIEQKDLSVSLATSSEICRRPVGDCTEHAFLLAALARLADIPARVASGLAYVPFTSSGEDMMGYHMWTQLHMDGRWVDFDAIQANPNCPPTRIPLATSALADDNLSELAFTIWNKIGNINVSILSSQ